MPWPDMTTGATYDVFELSSEELIIGSAATSDLALSSPHLSGRHARIRRSAVGFFVKDLDTSSGTFVNGRRVMGEAPAKAGDRLSLGGMVLTLSSLGLERPHGRAQPFIEIRHLCIDAKTHRLLDNISFTVLPENSSR